MALSSFTSVDQHRGADGNVDWKSYTDAQVANGEICYRCGESRFWSHGCRELCSGCKAADNDKGEVDHDRCVRCPKCRHQWDVYEGENYDLMADGEHRVSCPECGREFDVSTSVSYSYQSPKLIGEEDGDED